MTTAPGERDVKLSVRRLQEDCKTHGDLGEDVEEEGQHGQVDPDPLSTKPLPQVLRHGEHLSIKSVWYGEHLSIKSVRHGEHLSIK